MARLALGKGHRGADKVVLGLPGSSLFSLRSCRSSSVFFFSDFSQGNLVGNLAGNFVGFF